MAEVMKVDILIFVSFYGKKTEFPFLVIPYFRVMPSGLTFRKQFEEICPWCLVQK